MEDLFSSESIAEYTAFAGRHMFMVGIWLAAFAALIYLQVRLWTARIKKISSSTASLMINHEDGIFVDVRANNIFSKGHIAGAINVTAAEIKSGKTQRIESAREKPVILVGKDKFDSDAFTCAGVLKKAGFKQIFTLEGGIAQWSSDNLPLSYKR